MKTKLYSLLTICICGAGLNPLLADELMFTQTPVNDQQEMKSELKPFTGRVIGNKVRLRASASLEGHVIRQTNNGELFAIVGEENDFYAVRAPQDLKGYVFRTFVLDNCVEGDRVNVRLYPDVDAPTIGRFNRGEKIESQVSAINNKWLEVTLPSNAALYIAKEYIEKCGPVEMYATHQQRLKEANHHLIATFHFAQSELQKPYEQIDLDSVNERFSTLKSNYADLAEIVAKASELDQMTKDRYVQKKIAFLESKASGAVASNAAFEKTQVNRLKEIGFNVEEKVESKIQMPRLAETVAEVVGLSEVASIVTTDKMVSWKPLEESIYHLWLVANGSEDSMDAFYEQEKLNASILTGLVEEYTRPVKNRPGDFILKSDSLPVAFLYSTCVNLQDVVGKKVTLRAAPRPNNNFAFPAYYVLSVE